MIIGRALGWLFLVGAAVWMALELGLWAWSGSYATFAVAEFWAWLHANSLVGFQALVEKSISPAIWNNFLVPILSAPGWLVLGLPGAVLALAFRRRRRRRRRPRFAIRKNRS